MCLSLCWLQDILDALLHGSCNWGGCHECTIEYHLQAYVLYVSVTTWIITDTFVILHVLKSLVPACRNGFSSTKLRASIYNISN